MLSRRKLRIENLRQLHFFFLWGWKYSDVSSDWPALPISQRIVQCTFLKLKSLLLQTIQITLLRSKLTLVNWPDNRLIFAHIIKVEYDSIIKIFTCPEFQLCLTSFHRLISHNFEVMGSVVSLLRSRRNIPPLDVLSTTFKQAGVLPASTT